MATLHFGVRWLSSSPAPQAHGQLGRVAHGALCECRTVRLAVQSTVPAARLAYLAQNLYQDWWVADTRRWPRWCDERKAVLVQLPASVAGQLTSSADVLDHSVFEVEGRLTNAGLASLQASEAVK